jgi:predicted transcriptional regulator
MSRKKRAAKIVKEGYEMIRDGKVASIEFTEKDGGSFAELLVYAGDARMKLKIGRGKMKNWR